MAIVEIPFSASRPQVFRVTLGGIPYQIKLAWNDPAQCWVIDIYDTIGNPLVRGIPLITGTDLVGQFPYLNFGGQLLVISDQKPPDAVPGWADLGVTGHLYFVSQSA
jgi:hypothetical protein